VDAKYVKGMLNNPDAHPNMVMNQWIAAILLFDFELVHVPGKKFVGPDALSRREKIEDKGDIDEEWMEEILGCSLWVVGSFFAGLVRGRMEEKGMVLSLRKEKKGRGGVEVVEELPEMG